MHVHSERQAPVSQTHRTPIPRIVGIGASAGGLEAFSELLRGLPVDTGAAYVLVQHLDPTHRSLLSELLAKATTLPVKEITDGERVQSNHIYVIPPNCNLEIKEGTLVLSRRRRNSGPTRSIDSFLKSLAADQKSQAIGVILSGAGSDGAQGLNAIKLSGGLTFAQELASARYDSMPRAAVSTGSVDFVLAPQKIAEEIARVIREPSRTKKRAAANAKRRHNAANSRGLRELMPGGVRWPTAPEDANLRKLFLLIRTKTGVDFSYYKPNTIRRRLNRRMGWHKLRELQRYTELVRDDAAELEALYQDLLINVTSFFRNPGLYTVLSRKVLPKLLRAPKEQEGLRLWVAGCSTGQEAYSLAMLCREFAERNEVRVPVQIFATDVNGAVLEQARQALYTPEQVAGVSAPRLQQFFAQEDGGYRIVKPIRDLVIFAQHNLMADPPFTRVDLISCRNLLIYIEPALQQKILSTFHYALKAGGVLVLGSSESVGHSNHLFDAVEKAHRVYTKRAAASWLHLPRMSISAAHKNGARPAPVVRESEFNLSDAQKEADRIVLTKYAPVSVLINDEGEILQFRGEASRYLDLPTGKANFQLTRMAKDGLALPLHKLIQRAKRDNKLVRETGVRFQGQHRSVNIEIMPLKEVKGRCFLVVFERPAAAAPATRTLRAKTSAPAGQLTEMRAELDQTREHLRSVQEEHETAVEELQASNEEVQSSNEELQSLNEELETSNEELESANEELTTLNEELATRNTELRESEQRLREQAELLELAPVLARSPKERIIFWNRGAEALYGFTKEEAMGETCHLLLGTEFPEPLEKIQARLLQQGHWEGELLHRRKDGKTICVATQWLVHYDEHKKVRAILQVDTDITRRKQAEKALLESESFNRSILESSPDAIHVLDPEGRVIFVNPLGEQAFQPTADPDQAPFWPALWRAEERGKAESAMREALRRQVGHFQSMLPNLRGQECWWDVALRAIVGLNGRPERLLAVARDITAQKEAEVSAREQARLTGFRADVALAVSQAGEGRRTLVEVAEAIARHLNATFVRFWLSNTPAGTLEAQGEAGESPFLAHEQERVPWGEGLIGEVAVHAQSELEQGVQALKPRQEATQMTGGQTLVFTGIPLRTGDRVLGVLGAYSETKPTGATLVELEQAVERVAQFIERKSVEADRVRLQNFAAKAGGEVDILSEIGNKIAAELDLQKLAQAVIEAATRLTGADLGVFTYHVLGSDGERRAASSVSGPARSNADQVSFLEGICQEGGRDLIRGDFDAGASKGGSAFKSYLAVPVLSRSGELLGRISCADFKANAFTEREEWFVRGLAAQASVAMDNAQLFNQLERKVSERTVRLEETIAELEAFSYTVSHDLRAPLRAMQSYAQVLKEDYASQLDARASNYLVRIERSGMRLDRLIQDVLTYSRVSRAAITLTPVCLDKLVSDIIQQYPNLQPPAATIDIESPLPTVQAEESSVAQCFSNLLGNAVKFIRLGTQPHVRIRSELRDPCYRVWVEDNGIGIAPEHQDRIFRMFERVDGATTYEGTGIGLAIVRKAMERMGGQVGVESALGQGSRFWLEFKKP